MLVSPHARVVRLGRPIRGSRTCNAHLPSEPGEEAPNLGRAVKGLAGSTQRTRSLVTLRDAVAAAANGVKHHFQTIGCAPCRALYPKRWILSGDAFSGGWRRDSVKSGEVAGCVLGGEDDPAVAEAEDRDVAAPIWIDEVGGSVHHQHGDRFAGRLAIQILCGWEAGTDRRDGPNFNRQFQREPNAHLPAVGVSDGEDARGIDVERLFEI